MDSKQFRSLIVRPTLVKLEPIIKWSVVAEELLMFTWAHESEGGYYLAQVGGPALGPYGMEPRTHDDIWGNFLVPSHQDLWKKISAIEIHGITDSKCLITNLAYATAMCRVHYWRVKEPLPGPIARSAGLIEDMASYWARHYQTENDPVKIREAIQDYERYVR